MSSFKYFKTNFHRLYQIKLTLYWKSIPTTVSTCFGSFINFCKFFCKTLTLKSWCKLIRLVLRQCKRLFWDMPTYIAIPQHTQKTNSKTTFLFRLQKKISSSFFISSTLNKKWSIPKLPSGTIQWCHYGKKYLILQKFKTKTFFALQKLRQ